ncbi:MAG: paraquat-inducible protein A [Deltaproteobacteria bacterium]|nr:MAG: paraquat-inducible protein A [Deltaproteobacteria bacterium]
MNLPTLIACHECDLLHRTQPVPSGQTVRCCRCGAVLARTRANYEERILALTLTGLILFLIANLFPFLSFSLEGQIRQITLLSGVAVLYSQGLWAVAGLVLVTIFLAPLSQIVGLLYIFIPLYFRKPAVLSPVVFKMIQKLRPWSMMEVFMLGTLVTVVKLSEMATIIPGVALYALFALVFVLAAVTAGMDPHRFWQQRELQ